MGQAPLPLLAPVLRGLATGRDPARLLDETVQAATAATGAQAGALVGDVDGAHLRLASAGDPPALVLEAAEAALSSGWPARRREGRTSAFAQPLRVGSRVVGALAVGGARHYDPASLPLFADAAALAVARRPPPASAGSPFEVLDAVAGLAADLHRPGLINRVFDAAERLFGARGGFYAATDGAIHRVAHVRGIPTRALHEVAARPDFRALLRADRLRVEPPTHPVAAGLGSEPLALAVLPLPAGSGSVGRLVLLLPEVPDAGRAALLEAFGAHVTATLQSAAVHEQLGEKERHLSAVVHAMANPVVVVDEHGNFLMANGAAVEVFHLAGAFEAGLPVEGRLGDERLERMLAGEATAPTEVLLGHPEPRLYRATVRRVASARGNHLGWVLVLDDLTAEREADRVKGDFLAVVGHELRTPLTVMKGYVHLLRHRADDVDAATREEALAALADNTVRLERLIDDLLFVSAVENSPPPLHLDGIDLAEVVDAYAGERVVVRRPPSPLVVAVDRAKLDQVLRHLVDNALKYSEGPVVLEVAEGGEKVEFSVLDRGEGIYSGDLPRLFERFRQLDGGPTRLHGGTGLGLYICRRLVEVQGGRIWCESRLGVGSRFAFTLPRSALIEHGGSASLHSRGA